MKPEITPTAKKQHKIQLIQLRLSFQKRKLLTMSVQGMMEYYIVYLGSDAQGITFVARKLVVQSFLCALDAVSKK